MRGQGLRPDLEGRSDSNRSTGGRGGGGALGSALMGVDRRTGWAEPGAGVGPVQMLQEGPPSVLSSHLPLPSGELHMQ